MAQAMAAEAGSGHAVAGGPEILGIPLEFLLFAATLTGVAFFTTAPSRWRRPAFDHHRLQIRLHGLSVRTRDWGLLGHLWHERIIISNLILLLLGFAVLARHFEDSKAPDAIPRILPDDWLGGLALLGMIFVMSGFLDNIAAALIGGVVAKHVFEKVHIGYLAAIVASSNAGAPALWSATRPRP